MKCDWCGETCAIIHFFRDGQMCHECWRKRCEKENKKEKEGDGK